MSAVDKSRNGNVAGGRQVIVIVTIAGRAVLIVKSSPLWIPPVKDVAAKPMQEEHNRPVRTPLLRILRMNLQEAEVAPKGSHSATTPAFCLARTTAIGRQIPARAAGTGERLLGWAQQFYTL